VRACARAARTTRAAGAQVIRPLLPRAAGGEQPAALGRFPEAEALLQDDARFSRVPAHERCAPARPTPVAMARVAGRCGGPNRAPRGSEKLWRRYVEDIVLERDNPEALARRARMGGRTVARPLGRDVSAVTDKAYEREYLEPDRKRVRRD